MSKVCFGCGEIKEKLGQCTGCEAAYYCSQKCQLDHWPRHKFLCKKPKPKSDKIVVKPFQDPNTCYFLSKKHDSGVHILVTIEHTIENYLPATCRFFISVLNDGKDEITIDVENFVTLDVGEYKIRPKVVKNDIPLEEPKISSNPEEEEKTIENEMQQMINQLKLNEKSKLFSLKGQLVDDVITKQVLKPKEYCTCEITFAILMEYRFEKDFMEACKKMYFSLVVKEEAISFDSEFDQEEIKAFYKGFVPGSKMVLEKNKKYPSWKGGDILKQIPVMTEEEWLESMEK